jgi:hypothetical protein
MSPHERKDIRVEKELQRVGVISSCVKGDMAHVNRGRPSPRRLPQRVRYQPNLVHEEFVNIGLVMVALDNADFGDVRFLENWTPACA